MIFKLDIRNVQDRKIRDRPHVTVRFLCRIHLSSTESGIHRRAGSLRSNYVIWKQPQAALYSTHRSIWQFGFSIAKVDKPQSRSGATSTSSGTSNLHCSHTATSAPPFTNPPAWISRPAAVQCLAKAATKTANPGRPATGEARTSQASARESPPQPDQSHPSLLETATKSRKNDRTKPRSRGLLPNPQPALHRLLKQPLEAADQTRLPQSTPQAPPRQGARHRTRHTYTSQWTTGVSLVSRTRLLPPTE